MFLKHLKKCILKKISLEYSFLPTVVVICLFVLINPDDQYYSFNIFCCVKSTACESHFTIYKAVFIYEH